MKAMIAIDTTVLVALIDGQDKWHKVAVALREALKVAEAEPVYFDCVINETISILARRTAEQGRSSQFSALLDQLVTRISPDQITWISAESQRVYNQILDLVRSSGGQLNFHDALISVICQELGLTAIASFDQDFDLIPWLTRVRGPDDVPRDLGTLRNG